MTSLTDLQQHQQRYEPYLMHPPAEHFQIGGADDSDLEDERTKPQGKSQRDESEVDRSVLIEMLELLDGGARVAWPLAHQLKVQEYPPNKCSTILMSISASMEAKASTARKRAPKQR